MARPGRVLRGGAHPHRRRQHGSRRVLSRSHRRRDQLGRLVVGPAPERRRRRGQHRAEVLGQLGVVVQTFAQGGPYAADLSQQHPRIMRPDVGLPGRGPGDQCVEVRRDRTGGVEGRRRRNILVHVGVRDLDGRLAGVRLLAGEELEQHDPGTVDVGPGVGLARDHQLRRQVRHGADQQALGRRRGLRADGFGQTEVGDLDLTAVADQHVLGLHVPVHQPGIVGRRQRREHRLDDLERPQRSQRCLAVDDVAQGLAVDVLHHDVRPAGLAIDQVLALVEDRHHIGVGQPGSGSGFTVELLRELGVVTRVRRASP